MEFSRVPRARTAHPGYKLSSVTVSANAMLEAGLAMGQFQESPESDIPRDSGVGIALPICDTYVREPVAGL